MRSDYLHGNPLALREKVGEWRRKARLRRTLARLGYLILLVIFSTLLLSNVLKNLDQTRVNARIILMCTRNARRKRGKLDSNGIRHGPCSREGKSMDPQMLNDVEEHHHLGYILLFHLQ